MLFWGTFHPFAGQLSLDFDMTVGLCSGLMIDCSMNKSLNDFVEVPKLRFTVPLLLKGWFPYMS